MKAQFRFTAQKLGLEQAKHNSQAIITRSDIATLIQQRNVLLAREKAEKLIQDETMNNILEAVEAEIGVILQNFHEVEQRIAPSPVLVGAASTIIYAAPYINSKELDGVRNFLSQRLGPEITRSATNNRAGYVSQRVLKAISSPVPSAYHLDYVLHETTKSHGIPWSPDPPPREFVVNSLSECLDIAAAPEVDLPRLRNLCLRGLPDKPAWLRPRIWKILLGLVSPKKSAWTSELANQRDAYYDFVRRLLQPFLQPAAQLPTQDEKLLEAYKELAGLPRDMFLLLEEEPEPHSRCPLSDDADEDIQIPYARILESRLKQIIEPEEEQRGSLTPAIRLELEPELSTTPGISLTTFDSGLPEGISTPQTLLASRKCTFGNMHARHCSALLRLLYLHNAVNPANSSSHAASILVPLYSAMLQEVETEDLTHVEADTFWLLESIVAELSEVGEDGGQRWMTKLAQRLAWADYDLFTELQSQGLDPALPHYSYRWLATILAHTLPLSDLFLAWDALFSRESRKKGLNPKLDYLVNICTAMILRGKNRLHRIWRVSHGSRSLWTGAVDYSSQRSNSHDSFLESLTFLQNFDLKYIGGIERALQTAADLVQRRGQQSVGAQQSTSRFNFWKNYSVEQVPKDDQVPRKSPMIDVAETPDASWQNGLASQIASTVWRGITNQTAMDDVPPSPNTEVNSPIDTHIQSAPATSPTSPSMASSDIWGYAEKIKDSDALARLSKVGTNWKAMTMLSTWGNATTSVDARHPTPSPSSAATSQGTPSPESPRLSISPSPKLHESGSTPQSPQSNGGVSEKTRVFFTTRSSVVPTPKSPPKPLLLLSHSRITSGHFIRSSIDQQLHSAPTPASGEKDEWAEVTKNKHFHRDSQSSVSSLSPSDAFARATKSARSDWESDTTSSRIVPLNRRSVSPMAPHYRRPSSRVSSTSSASDLHSPPTKAKSPLQESSSIDAVVELGRSEPTSAPTKSGPSSDPETSDTTSYQTNAPSKRPIFDKDVPEVKKEDSRTGQPARSARVRSRRHPRPPNLLIHDVLNSEPAIEEKSTDSSKNLTIEWPVDRQENTITPRASSFDSDEHGSAPGVIHSPRRSERPRKVSTDNANEERPRKLSSRSRKVSTDRREAPRSRRESAAEEGDDEGYDELLSAYESEDTTNET